MSIPAWGGEFEDGDVEDDDFGGLAVMVMVIVVSGFNCGDGSFECSDDVFCLFQILVG